MDRLEKSIHSNALSALIKEFFINQYMMNVNNVTEFIQLKMVVNYVSGQKCYYSKMVNINVESVVTNKKI